MSANEAREAIETILAHQVTLGTRKLSIADWIEEYGADTGVVLLRLTAGKNLRQALHDPIREPVRWTTKPKGSRFRGVVRHGTRRDRWYARISNGGRLIDLGTSENELIAASLYNIAARNRDGLAAKINLV